jgi:hypothetical protein
MQLRASAIAGYLLKDLKSIIKEAYDVRGKLVHGGQTLTDALKKLKILKKPNEYALELRSIVRTIIENYLKLIIQSKKSVNEINKELDLRIFKIVSHLKLSNSRFNL